MKKKKDAFTLGAGALAVAVVVAILVLSWGGSSSESTGNPNSGATTTSPVKDEPVVQKPAAKPATVQTDTTVRGVVNGISGVRTFASLLASTGVGTSLTGAGPYTVFVPTDTAFSLQGSGFVSGLSNAQKMRLTQYHVIVGKALDLDAVSSGNHTALSKDVLNFNVNLENMRAYVNSGVSISQHKASNGIVYVISAVLVPPQTANPSTGSTGTPTPR